MKRKKVGHLAKVCKTKGEDRSKKGDIRQVSEDDEFAFTVQTCGRERTVPNVDIEFGGEKLKEVLVD